MHNKLIIKHKKIVLLSVTMVSMLLVTACQKLDAIGSNSVKSFEKLINEIPDNVTEDDNNTTWSLEAPDGSARFIWSQDFNKTDYDAKLEFDVEPFIAAGLDSSLLPEGMIQEDMIVVGIDLGDDELSYEGKVTPLSSYEQIVKLSRDNISYHAAMDHYGIDLHGGMFEWAKDMDTNDKDIVFALSPEVFIEAGVNPDEVEGWVFAKVETMDKSGKKIEVDKLLKPFELQ